MKFFIRIQERDGTEVILNEFGVNLGECGVNSCLIVRHSGKNQDNYHFHIHLDADIKQQALRVRLKKLFPDHRGNKGISVKVADDSKKPLSYMFHEHTRESFRVPYNVGYTDENIKEFKETTIKIQTAIKENSPQKMIQDVYQQTLDANHETRTGVYTDRSKFQQYVESDSHYKIGQRICHWYFDRREETNYYLPNKFQLTKYAQQIKFMVHCSRSETAPVDYFHELCQHLVWEKLKCLGIVHNALCP